MLGEAFPDVLAAAQVGAAWAFERLWRDLAPLVAAYARAHGAAEPDDLTSEVFLGVFRGLPAFTGDERAFRSWVLVIAHRRILDEHRRRSRRPAVADADLSGVDVPGGDAEADALTALGSRRVRAVLEALPPDQRDVLVLRILGDLTLAQVAEIVGKREGAVKALQRRGLERLRRVLREEAVAL